MINKIEDQVICLKGTDGQPEYRIFIGGKLHPAIWHQKGPAMAGLEVEQIRLARKMKNAS